MKAHAYKREHHAVFFPVEDAEAVIDGILRSRKRSKPNGRAVEARGRPSP
jgi:hypothetical protein